MGWEDATALDRNQLTGPIAAQLYRALGSIAANIAEGYSRSTGFDRARFFEYALGSTRESDVWCLAGRSALGQAVLEARAEILAEIRKLLLAAITLERTRGRNRIVRRKAGAD